MTGPVADPQQGSRDAPSWSELPGEAQTAVPATLDGLVARMVQHDEVQEYQAVVGLEEEALRLVGAPASERALVLNLLAKAHFFLGHTDDAVRLTELEAAVCAEANDQEGHAKSLNNLGLIALSAGRYHVALEHLLACFDHIIHSGLPMHALASACLTNVGNLYHDLSDYPRAIQYFQLGIEESLQAGHVANEIAGLTGLGLTYKDSGQLEEALQQLCRALALAQAHNRLQDEAELLDTLAQVYRASGQTDLARRMCLDALDLARRLGAGPSELNALLNLGRLELEQPEVAVGHLEAALALATAADNPKTTLAVCEVLAEAYLRAGQPERAAAPLREALQLERRVRQEEHEQKVEDLARQLEMERATHQAEAYRLLNEAAQEARQQAEAEVLQRTRELETAHQEVVVRLGIAAEYRDDKTGSHTLRVSELAAHLAMQIGLPTDQVELIRLSSRLHDIGKIGVPDAVLLKVGKLTNTEFEIMQLHTTIGARMLQGSTTRLLRMAEEIALHHHERWDGSGYPHGLSGQDIPLSARIVSLADVWDALTTERPYKAAWTVEAARAEILAQSGRHFDPDLTRAFLEMVNDSGLAAVAPRLDPDGDLGREATSTVRRVVVPPAVLEHLQTLNTSAWDCRQTDPERSKREAQDALALAEQHDHPPGVMASLRTLAFSDLRTGDPRSALHRLNRALNLQTPGSDLALERDCKNLLAWLYKDLFNTEKATQYLLESLELSRRLEDASGQANALGNLGVVTAARMGDRRSALGYFEQALALHQQSGNLPGQANCLYNMADNLVELGEYALAQQVGRQAVEAARAAGNPVLEAVSCSVVGRALDGTGELKRAIVLHDEALETLRRSGIDAPDAYGWMRLFQAHSLTRQGRTDEAAQALGEVREVAERLDIKEMLVRVHHELAGMHKARGAFDEAMRHLEVERDVDRALNEQLTAHRNEALLMQFEVERAQSEAELYRLRTLELANANVALERANREKSSLLVALQEQADLLERQVREDALSGLYNRRHIETLLQRAYEDHRLRGATMAVAMIDIDHFKQVNDRYSHPVGDEVIRQVGRLLTESLSGQQAAARYGGEEFLLLLPDTTLEQAARHIERLRVAVHSHPWDQVAPGLHVSVSAGAAVNDQTRDYEKLVSAADFKLYRAKQTRNTVVV
ncbi:tetratricopeptide repeat protein [Deinococcus sonorensis]|uniref:Tetratricopeptide repeat protein n=2 Tax=Deinococcus sonorensis TaxID=309891 RepID=A0AAU7UAP6_9DEIO